MLLAVALVAVAPAAAPGGEAKESAFFIPQLEFVENVADSTDPTITIAKVMKGREPEPAGPDTGHVANSRRLASLVATGREISGLEIRVVAPRSDGASPLSVVRTDGRGYVNVPASAVASGPTVRLVLAGTSAYAWTPSSTAQTIPLVSLSRRKPAVLYLTDWDDTQKFTGVMEIRSDKRNADGSRERSHDKSSLASVFFGNPHRWETFPGAAEIYDAIRGRIRLVRGIVTGTPKALAGEILETCRVKGFRAPDFACFKSPRGLWDSADADPGDPFAYKLPVVERAVRASGAKLVILDGDSGESDPEVYREIVERFPGVAFYVTIHNITNDPRSIARYRPLRPAPRRGPKSELCVYENKFEAGLWLAERGLAEIDGVRAAARAIAARNADVLALIATRAIPAGDLGERLLTHRVAADLRALVRKEKDADLTYEDLVRIESGTFDGAALPSALFDPADAARRVAALRPRAPER